MQILPTIMNTEPVHVGTFRGFDVEVSLEQFDKHVLTLKGTLEHHVELGADARGNVTRIENALTALDKKLGALSTRLSDLQRQVENAREHGELDKYRESKRLNMLCKEAIEQSIMDNYKDNRLDTNARRELEREKKPSVKEKLQSAETPPRSAAKAAVPEL